MRFHAAGTAVNDSSTGNVILWPDMINSYINNSQLRLCRFRWNR